MHRTIVQVAEYRAHLKNLGFFRQLGRWEWKNQTLNFENESLTLTHCNGEGRHASGMVGRI
jgi:hypothetical protein